MRIKNRYFILILILSIFITSFYLLYHLDKRFNPKPITFNIDENKPTIALTFDDGPNSSYTQNILDVLYEYNVPATFFICGKNIEGNEKLIKQMIASGHELGNHTYNHLDLTTLSNAEIINEFSLTQEKLYEANFDYTLKYVRPPYGRYDENIQNLYQEQLILWQIDSGDWENINEIDIINNVVESVKHGDIIVFHDDNNTTSKALKNIIIKLKDEGYQFTTVTNLLQLLHI